MSKKKKKKAEVLDRGQPWEIAFDMEGNVGAVRDLAQVLCLMANGMDDDNGNAVGRVGIELLEYVRQIEQARHLIAMLRP